MISLNLTDCPIPFYRFQTPLALTTIHLNPKRMVVYIHPNTLITHPDNLTELKQHLTDEGYIFRVTAPAKPHLKVVKNDREEDRQ